MNCLLRPLLILSALMAFVQSQGQQVILRGKVSDERGRPMELVNVAVKGRPGGTTTNAAGMYSLPVEAGKRHTVVFSFIGYTPAERLVDAGVDDGLVLDISLFPATTTLPTAEIREDRLQTISLTRLDPRQASLLPTVGGGIETLIKTLPGVSSNNEMSSQYNVRGGNFDENLLYVNGIEIYRPFLIRSGQQEGLSFINPDMVENISFSAGGFSAEFGDKLSSVLDITYRKPQEFRSSAALSLLGANVHTEGLTRDQKTTWLTGARYKTTQYVLNAMETKGQYRPDFIDVQALLTHKIHPKAELTALGHYSRNRFKLIPQTRQTDFGTFQEAYRLTVYFDGQEVDHYRTGMGALSLQLRPSSNTRLWFTASAFSTVEAETFDIMGQYWIGRLETNTASEQFGNVVQAQGVGTFIDHARNYFNATVVNLEHKGSTTGRDLSSKWGVRFQRQWVYDRLNEWELIDSAGYTLPRPRDQVGINNPSRPDIILNDVAKAKNRLEVWNMNAFAQQSRMLYDRNDNRYTLTYGLRVSHWGYSGEWLLSPRANVSFKPFKNPDLIYRLSTGVYVQPPFYREIRNFSGTLYPDAKAQRSYHIVAGADYQFKAWNRPFVLTSELYFKYMDRLIPYEVENVRIRYYSDQQSKGYAAGIDLKINGEFVKGIESWASLSFMKTEEDILGDSYNYFVNTDGDRIYWHTRNKTVADTVTVFPGYVPRPSDQRLLFSMFFQDYIPDYPTYKVHLTLLFGSRLPFGPPGSERYQQTRRMPEYRRVDIGFSKQLLAEDHDKKSVLLRNVKNMWVSLEVFNLLQIKNTISYLWVKDVNNRQYGVPNYLTPRQLNLKLLVEF
ncbi:MAG TPA: carboxypeptidase-like regulatory domain-containing protein [Bacteroidales bacterium]|nr:carboxypeptidase-like regulatory domain-containing protein [Bacteroidales bacterium]